MYVIWQVTFQDFCPCPVTLFVRLSLLCMLVFTKTLLWVLIVSCTNTRVLVRQLKREALKRGPSLAVTCSFCHVPDTSLIECLTKINRMDIVHLMETSTEPLQDHTSRSSVDTGRTTALDDNEGQSVWGVRVVNSGTRTSDFLFWKLDYGLG